MIQTSVCPEGLPPDDLAGSTTVLNASRWPSGLQAGEMIAAFVLTATSVNFRASPSTSSIVHKLNQRLPRWRAFWNAIRFTPRSGDHVGNRPKPTILFSFVLRSTVQISHCPLRLPALQ